MSALRTPAGRRRDGWADHLVAALGCLAATACTGAVLVLAAQLAETLGQRVEGPGLLAAAWVLGIGMMSAPLAAWPLVLPGGAALALARRRGLGGWAVAALLGAALAAIATPALAAGPADAALRLAMAAYAGLAYWYILDLRLRGGEA